MSDLDKALEKALERKPNTETTETQKRGRTSEVVRGRGGHIKPVTPYTKRLTLDLTPVQDRNLAVWSAEHGTKKNRVLRAMIGVLLEDEAFQRQVLDRLDAEED